MTTLEEVLDKAMKILKRELTDEEFLLYLQAITPKIGDSVREIEEKTKDLTFEDVLKMARDAEKRYLKDRSSR